MSDDPIKFRCKFNLYPTPDPKDAYIMGSDPSWPRKWYDTIIGIGFFVALAAIWIFSLAGVLYYLGKILRG